MSARLVNKGSDRWPVGADVCPERSRHPPRVIWSSRARRGCLTAPQTIPEGDLIGASLPRDSIGRPPRPGRALLNVGDGTLVTVAIPV